ncbi:Laminin subunit alpha1like, partial [Caligus rogercresseyi]
RTLSITRGNSPLNSTRGLTLIPFQERDVSIGLSGPYEEPLFWDLPNQFRGDKIPHTTDIFDSPFIPTEMETLREQTHFHWCKYRDKMAW